MKYIKYKLLKYLLKNTAVYFDSYPWQAFLSVQKSGSVSISFDTGERL